MHGDMGWAAGAMMVIPALVWMGAPALIAWLVWSGSHLRQESPTPLDLLKESYARGRITREEFEQARKDLA